VIESKISLDHSFENDAGLVRSWFTIQEECERLRGHGSEHPKSFYEPDGDVLCQERLCQEPFCVQYCAIEADSVFDAKTWILVAKLDQSQGVARLVCNSHMVFVQRNDTYLET
jgi:hypothetical protein